MARIRKLESVWHCRISSSILNWRSKILKRYGLPEWHWWTSRHTPTIFFGMYHIGDYLRFWWHQSSKVVFWCGSDILSLEKTYYWKGIISGLKAEHVCENYVEQQKLREMGIEARVQQICLSDFPDISHVRLTGTHVYISIHPGREREYGLETVEVIASKFPDIKFHVYGKTRPFHEIWSDGFGRTYNLQYATNPNVIYHGWVSESRFNVEIRAYDACLRLNKFDGFGDILAKSCLLGQWPISAIAYPHVSHAPGLKSLYGALYSLRDKKEPNYAGREYWLQELSKDLI